MDSSIGAPADMATTPRHEINSQALIDAFFNRPKAIMTACLVAAAVFFLLDLVVPRGANPAIGYALLPVLAASRRKKSFVIWMAGLCTMLTWAGLFLEPDGAPEWMSVFDRVAMTVVLWVEASVLLRRLDLILVLGNRTRALEEVTHQLTESNEELDRFASVVSHDLRRPLHTISMLAQAMNMHHEIRNEEAARSLNRMQMKIDEMSELVGSLLFYGRAGSSALCAAPCDSQQLLQKALDSLDGSLRSSGAVVTHDSLPTVYVDGVLVTQVFQNLIDNAIKYRSIEPPRIHISARRDGDFWVFSVQDNGIGISESQQSSLFHSFTQLATAGTFDGVGLGLATCKRIVERHGGTITLRSTVGRGSTFSFSLPALMQNAQHPSDKPVRRVVPPHG